MATYNICNKCSGVDLGDYEGETRAQALDAMARDAGYEDYEDFCEQFGDHSADLVVTEITPKG